MNIYELTEVLVLGVFAHTGCFETNKRLNNWRYRVEEEMYV
jgi:hypothetical protein